MNQRRIYLDFIKVLSCFLVFIYHFVMDVHIIHPMFDLSVIFNLINRPSAHLAMVACSLFIIISGTTICISQNKNNYSFKQFLIKRLSRLIIPFYLSYMIYYIIKTINMKSLYVFYPNVNKFKFIFTLIGMDEYIAANGISTFTLGVGEWFLGCIILCYMFFIC